MLLDSLLNTIWLQYAMW